MTKTTFIFDTLYNWDSQKYLRLFVSPVSFYFELQKRPLMLRNSYFLT